MAELGESRGYSWPPFEPGNMAAAKHLATSEQALAPLREEHGKSLRADYPHLDGRRLAILADRLARLELGHRWLASRTSPLVKDEASGEVWPLLHLVEKWGTRAEQILAELEEEARAASEAPSLVRRLQEGSDGA